MKNFRLLFMLMLSATCAFTSCSKEGTMGPAGPQGEQGIAGAKGEKGAKGDKGDKGTAGEDGNANVTQYRYNTTFILGSSKQIVIPVGKTEFEKSQVYVYLQWGTTWYPLPGYVSSNYYGTSFSAAYSQTTLSISRKSGSSNISVRVRVIIVEANSVIYARQKAWPTPDYDDYHAVCEYYGIPE